MSGGGWIKIKGNADLLNAIRAAKVPQDGMVVLNSMYVPRWVKEALDLYNSNEGYAEMGLTEFLFRMNPAKDPK